MHIIGTLIAKFLINAALLYGGNIYFSGFTLTGGIQSLGIAALVITGLTVFIKPIIRFITAPLVWITFGLFLVIINILVLWIADFFLPSIMFSDYFSLVALSLIIGFVNSVL